MDMIVKSVRRIYHDARHNAFPSLVRHGGELFVAFRAASSHAAADGRIVILRSRDGQTWEEAGVLCREGMDLRDPRLLSGDGRLHIYTGALRSRMNLRDPEELFCFLYVSRDGRDWHEAEFSGISPDMWLWGVARRGAAFAGAEYGIPGGDVKKETANLLLGSDGMNWTQIAPFPIPSSEVGIDANGRGEIFALCRNDLPPFLSSLLVIPDPEAGFAGVEEYPMPRAVHGPMVSCYGDGCIIAGRCWRKPPGDTVDPNAGGTDKFLGVLYFDRGSGEFTELGELPGGGDCAYNALVHCGGNRAFMVYYSSHERECDDEQGQSSIYWAELEFSAIRS